ncbi:MAG TPA: fibronectin type III domain-containing protein [Flavobacteriales bacterium]|nr:fibronectin type III domain-containing protein [Flavobacteriales bacterium]
MSRIKKGLSRLGPTAMVAKARYIEQRMTGNPAFPDPAPSLADVGLAREALEAAITAAVDGGRTARAIRNARKDELKLLLDQLAGYVASRAEGNELAILSSGYEVRQTSAPLPEPKAPVDLRAELSAHPGRVDLTWAAPRGAVTYHVQVNRRSPDDQTAWELVGVSTKARFTVTGLESAKTHWFRVAAIGTSGMSPWSDVAHSLVR